MVMTYYCFQWWTKRLATIDRLHGGRGAIQFAEYLLNGVRPELLPEIIVGVVNPDDDSTEVYSVEGFLDAFKS